MTEKYYNPPRLAAWILGKLFPDNDKHTTLGDLAEVYNILVDERNLLYAFLWYWFQLLKAVPNYLVSSLYSAPGLFKSYFLIAFRTMRREKLYSFINILGLSVGLTCTISVYFFIKHEFSYDMFHQNIDNIHVVGLEIKYEHGINNKAPLDLFFAPSPLADYLNKNFDDVKYAIRASIGKMAIIKIGDHIVKKSMLKSEADLFNIFNFPLLLGNKEKVLLHKKSVVISESMWKEFFKSGNVVGDSLAINMYGKMTQFEINGVFKDIPSTSSMKFDIIINYQNQMTPHAGEASFEWNEPIFGIIVQLYEGARIEKVLDEFPNVIDRFGLEPTRFIGGGLYFSGNLYSHPFSYLHLKIPGGNLNIDTRGSILNSYVFALLGIFILMLACINITYLNTSISIRRSQEFKMRRTYGGKKSQLIKQLFFETSLPTILGLSIAAFAAEFLLPVFDYLVGEKVSSNYILSGYTFIFISTLIISVSVISGIYPAITLTSPGMGIVSDRTKNLNSIGVFKKLLLLTMFSIFSSLLIITSIMVSQITNFRNINLGYNSVDLFKIRVPPVTPDSIATEFKIEIENLDFFDEFTSSSYEGRESKIEGINRNASRITISNNFIDFMGIEVLEGKQFEIDSVENILEPIMVNKTFVNELELTNPIGKTIEFEYGGYSGRPVYKRHRLIIGVVRDFFYRESITRIRPLVLYRMPKNVEYLYFRINYSDLEDSLQRLKGIWQKYFPDFLFEMNSVNDSIKFSYGSDEKWARIMTYSAALSFMITYLGLVGIIALSMASRRREIGVRKSMGASTTNILKMINKEYIWLIMLSNLIAWPVAYLVMERWLGQFYYKIDLTIWYFIGSSLIGLVIAVLTISAQAYKAASANSVDALRRE